MSTQEHAQIRKTRQGGVDAALIQALDAAAAAKDRGLCVVRADSQLAFSLGLKLSFYVPRGPKSYALVKLVKC